MKSQEQLWSGLNGLAITPPVIGRISIGRVVERNGRRLPEKDDQFTLTSQLRHPTGWYPHPLDEKLRAHAPSQKLRSIPVRLLFDAPDLNLRTSYTAFDRAQGRPVCTGDGRQCQRQTETGPQTLPCPTPDRCDFAAQGACKPYGRLYVQIGEEDPTGVFILRTTSFNTIRTLTARLHYFAAVSGGVLSCLPLELRLRGKSTAQSHGTPVFYVDLVLPQGLTMVDAIQAARAEHSQRQSAGHDQAALDHCAREGLAMGLFEEHSEEAPAVVEEFYQQHEVSASAEPASDQRAFRPGGADSPPLTLSEKLAQRR